TSSRRTRRNSGGRDRSRSEVPRASSCFGKAVPRRAPEIPHPAKWHPRRSAKRIREVAKIRLTPRPHELDSQGSPDSKSETPRPSRRRFATFFAHEEGVPGYKSYKSYKSYTAHTQVPGAR